MVGGVECYSHMRHTLTWRVREITEFDIPIDPCTAFEQIKCVPLFKTSVPHALISSRMLSNGPGGFSQSKDPPYYIRETKKVRQPEFPTRKVILCGPQFLKTTSLPFSTPVQGFKSFPSNCGFLSGPAKYAFDQSKLIFSNAHFGTCSVSAFGSQVIIDSFKAQKIYQQFTIVVQNYYIIEGKIKPDVRLSRHH